MRAAGWVLGALWACPAPEVDADPCARPDLPGPDPALAAAMAAPVTDGRLAGLGVAWEGAGASWAFAAGDADPGADDRPARPATPHTPFLLASVTKPVVATLALQLVEDGRLDLDADLAAIDPAFAGIRHPSAPGVPLTVRHLLTHTSGVRDTMASWDATWTTSGDAELSMREFVLGYFAASGPYAAGEDAWGGAGPGAMSCYSNMGFGLLGVVVEAAGGASLEAQLHERIGAPLGWRDTSFRADALCSVARGVRPGRRRDFVDHNLGSGPQPEGHPELASGMLKSSPAELVAFAAAIARGTPRLLGPASTALLLGRAVDPSLPTCGDGRSDPANQALGFTRFPDSAGRDWVGHYGGMNGAASAMWLLPADAGGPLAYVALGNVADLAAIFEVEAAMLRAFEASEPPVGD